MVPDTEIDLSKQFRIAVDLCGDGIAFFDIEGNVQFVNHAWARIHGYGSEELIGKPIQVFFSEERFATEVEPFLHQMASQGSHASELRHLALDGTTFTAWVTARELKADNGKAFSRILVARPVGERERALREKEENYRIFLEDASITFFMLDLTGNFTYTNKAGEKISGYTLEEAQSQKINFMSLLLEEDQERALRDLQLVFDGVPNDGPRTYRMRDKFGDLKYVEINTLPLTVGGTLAGFHGTAVDVTDRVEAATRLNRARSLEAGSALARGIAQEFNTILGKVLDYADLAMGGLETNHGASVALSQIAKETRIAKDLAQHILTMSGGMEQPVHPVRLQSVVEDVLRFLRAGMLDKIEVHMDLDPSCDPVLAHGNEMHQLVMNLCSNACQAMSEEGGILSLELTPLEIAHTSGERYTTLAKGRHVKLIVSDTGVGMDDEGRRKAFDPHYTTKQGADGMGLWISHGIVKRSRGELDLYSERGKGSTFSVILPVWHPDHSSEHIEGHSVRPEGQPRVVLLYDDPVRLGFIRDSLWEQGYKVLGFEQPQQVLEALDHWLDEFEAVIVEASPKGINYVHLLESIQERNPDLEILLCVKEASLEETALGNRSHLTILSQACDTQELTAALQKILSGRTRKR